MTKKTKDTTKNKGAGAKATTPKLKKSKADFNNNSTQNQRIKIMDWLWEKRSITTAQAREHLDIMSPAPRIMELRKEGFQIVTVWDSWTSEHGIKHRIGRYVLLKNEPLESDKKGGGDV